MRRIVKLHEREGLGPKAIAVRLTTEGVPPPRGGERWRSSTVSTILATQGITPRASGAAPMLARMVVAMRDTDGATLGQIAAALNAAHIPSPRGDGRWHASSVCRLLPRMRAELAAGA